jgi:hypothetical protein
VGVAILAVTLIADCHGFTNWLNGSFPQPNITADAKGHHAWRTNNQSLKAFMLQHISCTNYKIIATLPTTATIFSSLHKHYEDLGTHTQITLIAKAFNTCFCPGIVMSHVIKEIDSLHTRILTISLLDSNHLCTVFLVNALGEHYP